MSLEDFLVYAWALFIAVGAIIAVCALADALDYRRLTGRWPRIDE